MNAAMKLDVLLAETREAGVRLAKSRSQAATSARDTLLGLERRLREALGGDTLRGMRDLSPGGENFYAARLDVRLRCGIDSPLQRRGLPALVVTKSGRVFCAWATDLGSVATGPLRGIRAEDLEPATRAIQLVLERHLARVERTSVTYDKVAAFSWRLASLVGFRM